MPAYSTAPAYNNINPPGFMPNQFNYQPQPTVQQPTSNLMTIFVSTEEEVLNYPVAAGLTVLLISFNQGKFWLKSTSTNGVPQPLRTFSFNEEKLVQINQNEAVTREEFKSLSDKLDKLLQDLGGGNK